MTRAVVEHYITDPTSAGLIVSYINDVVWYVAVARYTEPYGRGKQIVCCAEEDTLDEAVAVVSQIFIDKIGTGQHINLLAKIVKAETRAP